MAIVFLFFLKNIFALTSDIEENADVDALPELLITTRMDMHNPLYDIQYEHYSQQTLILLRRTQALHTFFGILVLREQ